MDTWHLAAMILKSSFFSLILAMYDTSSLFRDNNFVDEIALLAIEIFQATRDSVKDTSVFENSLLTFQIGLMVGTVMSIVTKDNQYKKISLVGQDIDKVQKLCNLGLRPSIFIVCCQCHSISSGKGDCQVQICLD